MYRLKILFALLFCAGITALAQSLNVTYLGQLTYSVGLNDVWGWADTANAKEYALVGLETGYSVVDVTNPVTPVERAFFRGATSIWRDIKSWGHYSYTVHDVITQGNSEGVRIVDLSTINSANPVTSTFKPSLTVSGSTGTLNRAHNIYIDENGVLYVFGSNLGNGGALMFDLTADPMNPVFLGAYDDYYFHDGVARGDTLWGAAINDGFLLNVDVSQKAAPQFISSVFTPSTFTHNVWFSDDGKTVFTTDERSAAFITAYDVTDPYNMLEVGRIQSSYGNNPIPHNVHVKDNFLVTSYYTSGLQIVDATFPDVMLETAYFDTSPSSGDTYDGAWGAYPWLPSENILVTDRQEGLFILSSTYPRATYINAYITDSVSGRPLAGADVEIVGGVSGKANYFGVYRDAQIDTGTFKVIFSMMGYVSDTLDVKFEAGVINNLIVQLLPIGFDLIEHEFMQVSVYPNPSTGSFYLDNLPNEEISLSVMNMAGQMVLSQELDAGKSTYFLEHNLPKGMYQLYFKNSVGKVSHAKLLVQ